MPTSDPAAAARPQRQAAAGHASAAAAASPSAEARLAGAGAPRSPAPARRLTSSPRRREATSGSPRTRGTKAPVDPTDRSARPSESEFPRPTGFDRSSRSLAAIRFTSRSPQRWPDSSNRPRPRSSWSRTESNWANVPTVQSVLARTCGDVAVGIGRARVGRHGVPAVERPALAHPTGKITGRRRSQGDDRKGQRGPRGVDASLVKASAEDPYPSIGWPRARSPRRRRPRRPSAPCGRPRCRWSR
jgi:hypothetical protein